MRSDTGFRRELKIHVLEGSSYFATKIDLTEERPTGLRNPARQLRPPAALRIDLAARLRRAGLLRKVNDVDWKVPSVENLLNDVRCLLARDPPLYASTSGSI
jgi:hypothetical protein